MKFTQLDCFLQALGNFSNLFYLCPQVDLALLPRAISMGGGKALNRQFSTRHRILPLFHRFGGEINPIAISGNFPDSI